MADAANRSIGTVLDADDPIELGYEAATPWLQAHCRPDNDYSPELTTREAMQALRAAPVRTGSRA